MQKYSSFLATHESEAYLAGYVGCPTIGDLRRLIYSPPALRAFALYTEIDVRTLKPKTVLDKLAYFLKAAEPPSFPLVSIKDIKDTICQSGSANAQDVKYDCIAKVVLQLTQELEAFQQAGNVNKEEQAGAEAMFSKLTGRRQRDLPVNNISTPPTFSLGPFSDLDEPDLEKFNRTLNILRHLKYRSMPTKWKTLLAPEAFEDPSLVSGVYRPPWMQEPTVITGEPGPSISDIRARAPFFLEWTVMKTSTLYQQLAAGERKLTVPEQQEGWLTYHPMHSTFEEFRDGIRRQFQLHAQGFTLREIGLRYSDKLELLPEFVWAPGVVETRDWEDVQSSYGGMATGDCTFTFQAIDADDEYDYEYESTKAEDEYLLADTSHRQDGVPTAV